MLNILVLLKLVPDTVEELEVAADGRSLDPACVRLILSERDEHALEQALLLRERHGGTVTVAALDVPELDDVLFTALAKGADRAVKVCGIEPHLSTRTAAAALARALASDPGLLPADLILTGVQAIDDLDGQVGPTLARTLELPYLGIICGIDVTPDGRAATVRREYSGGVIGTFAVSLPAVLGVQSAEKPPRYVPVARVRAAMKSQRLDSLMRSEVSATTSVEVLQLTKPASSGQAVMMEGSPEEVAGRICAVLMERGILQGR